MLICHQYIFFGELFGKNFGYFLIELFIFLLSLFSYYLYLFNTNYFSDISEIYNLCWNTKDCVHEYFWALYFVALYLLDDLWVLYSIIKSFGNITLSWLMQLYSKSQSHGISDLNFMFFFSILFWLFWVFHCCIKVTVSLLISTNQPAGILTGITLNLYFNLGRMTS